MEGKKFGGRKKGTPNVSTKAWRELIGGILYEDKDEFVERLHKLNEKSYVHAYISMLKYVCHQLSSVSIEDGDNGNDFMKIIRDLSKDAEAKESDNEEEQLS